jgi:hypothetical protein
VSQQHSHHDWHQLYVDLHVDPGARGPRRPLRTMLGLFVGALLACAGPPSTGTPCAESLDCEAPERCAAFGDQAPICVPNMDLKNTEGIEQGCSSAADCRRQGWPVEAVCSGGQCGCELSSFEATCGDRAVLDPSACFCVASQGRPGDACFDEQHCVEEDGRENRCDVSTNECIAPSFRGEACSRNVECGTQFDRLTCVDGVCRSAEDVSRGFCDDDEDCLIVFSPPVVCRPDDLGRNTCQVP